MCYTTFISASEIKQIEEKLQGLEMTIRNENWEDAAGNLCDLLEFCRTKCVSHDGRIFMDLRSFVAYYGANCKSLEEK